MRAHFWNEPRICSTLMMVNGHVWSCDLPLYVLRLLSSEFMTMKCIKMNMASFKKVVETERREMVWAQLNLSLSPAVQRRTVRRRKSQSDVGLQSGALTRTESGLSSPTGRRRALHQSHAPFRAGRRRQKRPSQTGCRSEESSRAPGVSVPVSACLPRIISFRRAAPSSSSSLTEKVDGSPSSSKRVFEEEREGGGLLWSLLASGLRFQDRERWMMQRAGSARVVLLLGQKKHEWCRHGFGFGGEVFSPWTSHSCLASGG